MKYLFICFLMVSQLSFSIAQSPLGTWVSIHDTNNKPVSHVEIYEQNGKLFGKIIKLLEAATITNCQNCPGDLDGKPLEGLVIINNLVQDGSEWNGGTILDPKTGDTYRVFIEMEGKNKLKVRGYIGFALFGRTQYWYRKGKHL